jgi:tight adherence protein B
MSDLLVRLLVLGAAFASVFLITQVFVSTAVSSRASSQAVNKRLKMLKSGMDADQVSLLLRKGIARRPADDAGPIAKLKYSFQRKVQVAAISTDAGTLFTWMVGAFVVIMAVLLLFAWSGGFTIGLGVIELLVSFAFTCAFALPWIYISRRAEKRRKRMEEQFPVALDVFVRALRAGHPVASAIELLTKEMEDPLGSEFGMVSDEVSYGANLNDALLSMADRWDIEDIRMFVISLSLQTETGGNLAEILGNLSSVIRERASMYMKVRALSSEGKMSGWMLTALPVLTFVSMFLVNPSFYLDVAADPIFIYGYTGLVILYIIAVITIRKMVDLKV